MLNEIILCNIAHIFPVGLTETILVLASTWSTRYLRVGFYDVVDVLTNDFEIVVGNNFIGIEADFLYKFFDGLFECTFVEVFETNYFFLS